VRTYLIEVSRGRSPSPYPVFVFPISRAEYSRRWIAGRETATADPYVDLTCYPNGSQDKKNQRQARKS